MAYTQPSPYASASGQPVNPYTSSSYVNPYAPPPAPAAKSGGGGFSIFGWHPSLPNLGGITAIKQLASGFIALPEQAWKIGGDVVSGNGEDLNPFHHGSTTEQIAAGFGAGVENLGTSAAGLIGVPGTRYNLGDEVIAPVLEKLNAIGNSEVPFKPSTFWTRPGGPIAGLVQDAAMLSVVAGPFAAATEGTAATLADAAAKAAEAESAGTGTAEATAAASARAAQAAHTAEVAHQFAHPYGYLGGKVGELAQSAHAKMFPALAEGPAATPTIPEILAARTGVMDPAQAAAELRNLQAPETAATATIDGTLEQAQAELVKEQTDRIRAHQAEVKAQPDHVTLWRGERPSAGGSGVVDPGTGPWYADTKETAQAYAGPDGTVHEISVPKDVADATRTQQVIDPATGEPTGGTYDLGRHEHGATYDEHAHALTEATRAAEAKPPTPEEAAANAATETARKAVPESSIAQKVAAQLAKPPAAWAQRITDILPPTVNRVLAAMATPIARHQVLSLARDLARFTDVAQRGARTSEFVKTAVQGAQVLIEELGIKPRDASIMIGEQVASIADATAFVTEHIKSGGDPELQAALHEMAQRGHTGITQDVWDALGPEKSQQVRELVDQAVTAWRQESVKRFNALLADPIQGARGLQEALLQTDEPHMTVPQARAYKQAVGELRLEKSLRERIPTQDLADRAAASRQSLLAERSSAEEAKLVERLGIVERTRDSLHDSIPLAIRAENIDGAVAAITEGVLNDGRITYDVGRNLASLPHEGFAAVIAHQFDVPVEGLDAAIRKAMQAPVASDGAAYGPGVFAGPDVRLTLTRNGQTVSGDLDISTWAGRPLDQWQATVLGEAHQQASIFDNTRGAPLQLSAQPDVQNLMALYASDALDAKSEFGRFGRQLAAADAKAARLGPGATDDALRLYATWDHALAESNPEKFKQGDYFKLANVDFGKSDPRSAALLAQTVLGLSTKDGLERALAAHDMPVITEALRWYYDSHDYIEKTYRGQTVTLLDGTQRDAADVFYDLVAVTSVMASPKQNFGRALMAMSNMNDFLKSKKDGYAAAKSLLEELQRKPIAKEELNGTKLSTRFLTPAVRKMTHQTSMVNDAKYKVFDVLSGKLRLDDTTDAEIAHSPEYWGSAPKSLLTGRGGIEPIFEKEMAHEDAGWQERSRQLSPEQWQKEAKEGQQLIKTRLANSTPNVLNVDTLAADLYPKVQESWGGETIDAHTGQVVQTDTTGGNQYAVTARERGQQTISIPETATPEEFKAALQQAHETFAKQLDSEGGHLGVFHQDNKHTIEIDPVYVTDNTAESDRIGMAAHATGGAYHFQSGNGYFSPYLKNDAIMEQAGSNLLAKLRSFRDNLANPDTSLAVTLDSVMAKMYGFPSTDWSGGDTYGVHANEIRDAAAMLSKRWGREVKPHEVQALLWVHTKLEIGRQNFGNLLAHRDFAQADFDAIEKDLLAGREPDIAHFDPLRDYHEEKLGRSLDQHADEAQRNYLRKQLKTKGKLFPEQRAELDAIEAKYTPEGATKPNFNQIRTNDVFPVQDLRDDIHATPESGGTYETRRDLPYRSATPAVEARIRSGWTQGALLEIRRSLSDEGLTPAQRVQEGRLLFDQYVAKQRRSIMGDVGGSFQKVGEETRAEPKDVAYAAEQSLNKGGPVPAPRPWLGQSSLQEIHQQGLEGLRGAVLTDPGKDGRLTMRLFKDAALDTLAHEGGHLLRQMLNPDDMGQLAARYPNLFDTTLTTARAADEERFVADLMQFIRRHSTEGDTGPLSDVMRRISATLEEQHAATMDSALGRSMSPDIQAFWSNLFHPNLTRPDHVVDPIDIRRLSTLSGTETKQFPWEKPGEFSQRTRMYGEARARVEAAQFKLDLQRRATAKADASARKMWAAITNGPNKIEAEANRLHTHALNILDKLGRELENPSTGQVPRAFKPMWEGFLALHAAAKLSPEVADMLEEIPPTFSAALRAAAERGFNPEYVPDLTWERANRLLFNHIQLGKGDTTAVVSSMRKVNQGVLNRAGLADRSIEALASGTVEATHALYSNTLVKFVQDHWAKPLEPGSVVPEGWEAWDPARDFILTGTDKRGDFRAANAKYIIPKAVDSALTSMSKRYDHWIFHTVSKVTRPWVTYSLTLSPRWYLHVFVSNVVRAVGEGVKWGDVRETIHQWKSGTLPEEVYGHGIAEMIASKDPTLIGMSVKDAMKTDGVRAAVRQVQARVAKVHDVVDEISRGAVFEHTLRTGGTRAQALTRSYEAMVDYGALSPFERSAVRSLIPFYPFYKGMVKLLARFPADHPQATAALLVAGKIHEEYLQDRLGGKLPDAYMGLANIGGLHNFTILDPFLNPVHLVDIHEVSNVLNPFVDIGLRDAYNAAEPGTGTPGMTATGQKVSQVNPAAALGASFAGAPLNRALAQILGGGDVYGKSPNVAGAIGQYLGTPQTPDTAKIQATLAKTLGTAPKKGQPGYIPKPRTTRVRKASTRSLHHSLHRIGLPKVRKPRRPR